MGHRGRTGKKRKKRRGSPPPAQAPSSLKPYVLRVLKLSRLSEREPGKPTAARPPPPGTWTPNSAARSEARHIFTPAPPRPQAGTALFGGKRREACYFWQPQARARGVTRPVPPCTAAPRPPSTSPTLGEPRAHPSGPARTGRVLARRPALVWRLLLGVSAAASGHCPVDCLTPVPHWPPQRPPQRSLLQNLGAARLGADPSAVPRRLCRLSAGERSRIGAAPVTPVAPEVPRRL